MIYTHSLIKLKVKNLITLKYIKTNIIYYKNEFENIIMYYIMCRATHTWNLRIVT